MTTDLEGLLQFWKDTLAQYRPLFSPSVQYLVEQTIKDLEELKERRQKDGTATVKE